MIKNYYQILDIDKNASIDEIKKAYRLYAQKFHPDKHQGDKFFEERFKEVNEAYDILMDPQRRAEYDKKYFGNTNQQTENDKDTFEKDNVKNDFSTKHQERKTETQEEIIKRELKEKRTKGCLIGIGTGIAFFILLSLGSGWWVPIGIVFLIWTIRQIFVVLTSYLKD